MGDSSRLLLALWGVFALVSAPQLLLRPVAAQTPVANTLLAAMKAHLPALLQGITGSYPRSVAASTFVIWSPTAFPVAIGGDPNTPLPVVAAAAPPSGGRVVAFGHESIPGGCCSTKDGWDKLVLNAVRWLAGGKSTVRIAAPPTLAWATSGIAAVKPALTGITVQTSAVSLDTFVTSAGSANVDIYWIDTTTNYTAAQVTALLKFANTAGKGLLVAGQTTSWGGRYPNANIFMDLAVNRVLWPLGLAVATTDAQTGFQTAPTTKPPADWLFYNSLHVASLLAAKRSGTATFSDGAMYPVANRVLNHLLKSLPLRAANDASGLTSVWALLESARTVSGSGVGPNSTMDPKNGYPGDVLDVNIEVWMNRRGDVTGLRPSRSAAAYPRLPPANAPRVTVTVTINATYNRPPYRFFYAAWGEPVWRTTGVYAAPGEVVTVTVPKSAAGKGLLVQVGSHTDDLTVKDRWLRVPVAVSRQPIVSNITRAGNPLGGPVYILVPKGLNVSSSLQVTVSNAIRMPIFKLGSTDLGEWAKTIRNYPAPWGELDSGKFTMMLPSAVVRNFTNPVALLNHWNLVMDNMAWLANIPAADRCRAERFLVDADIGGGWMHSGYPIMGHDEPATLQEVTDLKMLKYMGAWGTYHELGHNHQWGYMQFSGSLESFNNLWTIYALEQTGVYPSNWATWQYVLPDGRAALRADYFAKGANWARDWNNYVALDTYLQLKDAFGWGFYRKLYDVYNLKPLPLPDDEVQTWIQTTSAVAGVNLVPFYTKWGFPVSQKTISMTASLPTWTANPFKH